MLPWACLALLAPSGLALLVADRLPRSGPVRRLLYPLAVVVLSACCLFLTVVAAVRFDPRTAVPLAVAGTFLGLAGRRRNAVLQERDRLLRQRLINSARRPPR